MGRDLPTHVSSVRKMQCCLQGLSSAQDTLGSQAHGANDRPGVISWSVTTALCMSVLAVPMAVILYFGDALAIWIFQQPGEVADVRSAPSPRCSH